MCERRAHLVHGGYSGHTQQVTLQLQKPLLRLLARAHVTNDTDELTPLGRRCFPYRKFDREHRAVFVPPLHLAADTDDLANAAATVAGYLLPVPPAIF